MGDKKQNGTPNLKAVTVDDGQGAEVPKDPVYLEDKFQLLKIKLQNDKTGRKANISVPIPAFSHDLELGKWILYHIEISPPMKKPPELSFDQVPMGKKEG